MRLTWAVPVSAHLLGARLEAYVEGKATITTFRLCAQNGKASSAPVSRLPAELIDEVVEYLSQSFFEMQLPGWKKITRCMEDRCKHGHKHEKAIDRHLNKISDGPWDTDEGNEFAKCRQVHELHSIDDILHADDNARYLHKTSASRLTSTFSASMMKWRTRTSIQYRRG